tara:strand:- start:410 stop:595 length:186 start_codon:yes stop_codon:yes gene_type:complete
MQMGDLCKRALDKELCVYLGKGIYTGWIRVFCFKTRTIYLYQRCDIKTIKKLDNLSQSVIL